MQEKNLSRLVVRGGIWAFLLKIVQILMQVVKLIILARVLAPKDFGLMGVAMLTIATLETFSGTGFQAALIQKKEDIKPYLNAAWTVTLFRGVVLYFLLFIAAPFIADFFRIPSAVIIIRVAGISILLQAVNNIAIVYFQKELQFKKEFLYRFSGLTVDFIVSVVLALVMRNVWALVFGVLAGEFTRLIVGYLIHPFYPKLNFNMNMAKKLFVFGKWVLGSSIVVFLATHGDDAFLGKVLGVTMLGFYQLAFRLGNMPSSELTGTINRVLFPAYSKIQDNPVKLKEAYLKALTLISLLVIPFGVGIVIFSGQFIEIFLGNKWMPMVMPLRILAVAGLLRAIAGTSGPIFNALGKPVLDFKTNLTRSLIIIFSIYPLTFIWKINGTSISVLLGILGANFICFPNLSREINIRLKEYVNIILPPIFGTLIMGISCVIILKNAWFEKNPVFMFGLAAAAGISIYFTSMFLLMIKTKYKGLKELKAIINHI